MRLCAAAWPITSTSFKLAEMKISFVLPTYNESGHIISFLHKVQYEAKQAELPYEILLIDDNSPDGTGSLVEETFKNDEHVRVVIRSKERGLATAILHGIKESKGTHIFLMDTDFNHDPKYIPQFFLLSKFYDIVSGSRYTWGGDMMGGNFRYLGSMAFNYFLAGLLLIKSSDNTAGYVLFKKSILDKVHTEKIFKGYGQFFFRFLYAAKKLNLSLIEIPVVYSLRASGKSKTSFWKYIFIYFFEAVKLFFTGRKLIKK